MGFADSRKAADRFRNLRGRYVLALPAIGIADAIDEIEIAFGVAAHQVVGAKPAVAPLERAAQDLALVLRRIGVSLEPARRLRRVVENSADRLADLAGRGLLAEALRIADRHLPVEVEPHDRGRGAPFQEPRNPAYRARLSLDVEQGDVALGGAVELQDRRDGEARLELRPHVRPQAVAAAQAQPVRALLGVRRRIDEIAAQLADIPEKRALAGAPLG